MLSSPRYRTVPNLAAAPARVVSNFWQFWRANRVARQEALWRAVPLALGLVLRHPPLIIGGLLCVIPSYLAFRLAAQDVFSGSARAAKLVSIDPPRLAFYGELSQDHQNSLPRVTVVAPPTALSLAGLQSGDRLAVIVRGIGGNGLQFDRLRPRLLTLFTDDEGECERVLAMVPDWEWDELDEALFRADLPIQIGTYPLG